MKMFRILAIWCLVLSATLGGGITTTAKAQMTDTEFSVPAAQPDVEMADTLRQDGKIYVVVTVLLSVLGGLIIYLVSIDRKVGKLERQLKDDLVNH
ncbi:CcmD family protein [Pontibacter silvestris]|uniref:CcmD family protein n=1 Tax=Pontibacter silvestris TaxID=2305183 RepID=A0ABW4X515_9BACT|nr:hypothetical protein [Pontibacter silvestris]MCC9137103.1 hypothetical protein [Pontibacter silvestris]